MNGNAPFSKPFFTSKVDGLNRLDWVGMLRFRHKLGHNAPFTIGDLGSKASKKCIYPKESLSYGMPVYKFSNHLLAVLVHLAHTAVKWKTNVDDFVK